MGLLTFLFRSKGRHGTHSPFAYNFVEQVLREPKNIAYPKSIENLIEERRLGKMFFRLLKYLNEKNLFLDEHTAISYGWFREIGKFQPKNSLAGISQHCLIVVDVADFESYLTMYSDAELQKITFVILHLNHKNAILVNPFYKWEQFNCTIKTWDFSVLLFKENFKRKQHFNLR